MKRLALEVPYERFWNNFFGRHAAHVKVLEGLKCFKCDSDGFAIICRVKVLDKSVSLDDLKKGGPIQSVQPLYEEEDESVVIFIAGNYENSGRKGRRPRARIFEAGPPEFLDVNRMKITLVGEEEELQKYMRRADKSKLAPKILSLTQLKPQSESPISSLTPKQRQAVLAAYGLGYYDVPRSVSSDDMARLLKIDKSTLAEHLRKAERNLVKSVIAG